MLPLCRGRTWRPEYFVVTSLVSAGATAILVAGPRREDRPHGLAGGADGGDLSGRAVTVLASRSMVKSSVVNAEAG